MKFTEKLKKFNQSGFTLVELMVVVGIIGILASVAVPNLRKYQAKSKTTEAKLQLAAVYMTETSLYSDYDYYGSCLAKAGMTQPTENYYAVGFSAGADVPDLVAQWSSCTDTATYAFGATKGMKGSNATEGDITNAGTYEVSGTGDTFLAAAVGNISESGDNAFDVWKIDPNKKIEHVTVGY